MAKQRRVRKPDSTGMRRLLGTKVTSEASYRKIQNSLTEHDRVVSEYERKWGIDRLPMLVDEALRDRYWQQMDRLNAAIEKEDPIDVEEQVAVTIRAYAALEHKATELGGRQIEQIAWTAAMKDGGVIALVRNRHDVPEMKKEMPDALVYCIEEVAAIVNAWSADNKLVEKTRSIFADMGATVTDVKTSKEILDDDIPF